MAPSIAGPAPKNWSGSDFNVVCISSNTALDIGAAVDGQKVWAYSHMLDNTCQIFHFELVDANANIWTLQSTRSKFYLGVENGSTADRTEMATRSRFAATEAQRHNQEWYIYLVEGADGWPRIALQNVGSGTFMNLKAGGKADRTPIVAYHWDATDNCIWKLAQQLDKKK